MTHCSGSVPNLSVLANLGLKSLRSLRSAAAAATDAAAAADTGADAGVGADAATGALKELHEQRRRLHSNFHMPSRERTVSSSRHHRNHSRRANATTATTNNANNDNNNTNSLNNNQTHTIAFVMTDGDSVAYSLDYMAASTRAFADSARGSGSVQ